VPRGAGTGPVRTARTRVWLWVVFAAAFGLFALDQIADNGRRRDCSRRFAAVQVVKTPLATEMRGGG